MLIPLFPLSTVLFPGGVLHLQIFEVRYLDMIGRCWRSGQPFGVTLLTQGHEVRRPGVEEESFHDIGTLAIIDEMRASGAGLRLIRCRGTHRFRSTCSKREKNGAWSADVNLLEQDPSVAIAEHLVPTALGLRKVFASLAGSPTSAQLPPEDAWRFDDCGWVANRWCELLNLPMEVRYQLMALDSPLIRLELITDLLREVADRDPPADS